MKKTKGKFDILFSKQTEDGDDFSKHFYTVEDEHNFFLAIIVVIVFLSTGVAAYLFDRLIVVIFSFGLANGQLLLGFLLINKKCLRLVCKLVFIIGLMIIVSLMINSVAIEYIEWSKFKADHHCKVNNEGSFFNKTEWLCDDGFTYNNFSK